MAEVFLEEIYQEARLLCELRQMVEWAKVQDDHHVLLQFKKISQDLCEICKNYINQDINKGMLLWNAVDYVSKVKGDLILLGDILETKVIPLLEQYMKQWGRIELDNDEGDFRFETTQSGFLTLKNLERNIYYHSTVDPMWEARKLADYIFDPKKDTYSILGCGLGYLPYQLYCISNGSIKINVFVKDARMVEYARNYGVLDWIPEECLNVVVDEDILPFLYSVQESDVGYHLFTPEFRGESREMHRVLDDIHMDMITGRKFDRFISINFWRNIKSDTKLITEFDTSQLKKEFVVIAAGPSLDDNLEFLRKNKGKKTLIAVGTVFKKLIENGIIPDMVTLLDPQERTYQQIEGMEQQKVPMLIAWFAFWKFTAAYQGEKYLIPIAQNQEIKDYAIRNKMDLWGSGGTVTSLAMECAIRFGAEKIYLVGVDFAYPNGVSHATGTMDRTTKSTEGMTPIQGVGEKTVYATPAFITYRHWMEERITQTPQIAYYNLSRVGARIVGAIEIVDDTDILEELEPTLALNNPKRFLYISQEFSKEEWEKFWERTLKSDNDRAKLVAGMECLDHIGDSVRYEAYLTLLQKTSCMKWDEKYYLLCQIVGRLFEKSGIENDKITQMTHQIYHEITTEFMQEFDALEMVEGRNDKLVFFTIQQFGGVAYAPSKIMLDRARILKNKLGKNVILINTAECYGGCKVNLLHVKNPCYLEEYLLQDTMEYEGEVYPFMQFEPNMPNTLNVGEFLEFVKKYKPSYIVNVGGDSLLIDACSKLVPILNINTVCDVARTEATMQVVGRAITEKDEELLDILGKNRKHVLEGRFTYSLIPQSHHYTKAELGIPDNYFVLTVIGNRLTTEISDEFIGMLDEVFAAGAVLVIIGEMLNYDEVCAKNIVFKEHTICLGIQEDILAVLELCDLYVNPERKGGGTSVVYAMHQGCPAVTLSNGDVAAAAGEDFCVENYETMQKQILRYLSDAEFYGEMSEKAKERAAYMQDSDTAFVEIIKAFEEKIAGRTGV